MTTNKEHITFWLFVGLVIIISISGCSQHIYMPYGKSAVGRSYAGKELWKAKLPYSSGSDLTIRILKENTLIITEPGSKNYSLCLVNMEDVTPSVKYVSLEYGDHNRRKGFQFSPAINMDEGILLMGKRESRNLEEHCIYLIDPETLKPKYKRSLFLKEKSRFSISGIESNSEMLVLYQSDIFSDHKFYGNVGYPYIVNVLYTFQFMKIKDGNVIKYDDISGRSIETLSDLINMSHVTPSSETANRAAFYIDNVALADNNETLVFSMSNNVAYLNFSMDIDKGPSSIKCHTAEELAEKYEELTVAKAEPKKEWGKARQMMEVSGKYYEFLGMEIVTNSLILLMKNDLKRMSLICTEGGSLDILEINRAFLSAPSKADRNQDKVKIDTNLKRRWEIKTDFPYEIEDIPVADDINGIFYLPEQKDNEFILKGFKVKDGLPLKKYLPANFLVHRGVIGVAGTKFDFQKNVFYMHDRRNHQIICMPIEE